MANQMLPQPYSADEQQNDENECHHPPSPRFPTDRYIRIEFHHKIPFRSND